MTLKFVDRDVRPHMDVIPEIRDNMDRLATLYQPGYVHVRPKYKIRPGARTVTISYVCDGEIKEIHNFKTNI